MKRYQMLNIICCATLLLASLSGVAQQSVKLKNVAKIEFFMEYAMSRYMSHVEVVPEGSEWVSYRLKLVAYNPKGPRPSDTSGHIFIKKIPAVLLDSLVTIISRRDTSKNMAKFNISKNVLMDSIKSNNSSRVPLKLTIVQKDSLLQLVQSDSLIYKAFTAALNQGLMDDRNYYKITITTVSGITMIAEAQTFGNTYYLPWKVEDSKIYDPDISRVFSFASDDNRFERQEQGSLNYRLIQYLYFTEVRKKIWRTAH